jgi:hypothetical protein
MFFACKNCREFQATAGIVAASAFSHACTKDTPVKTAVNAQLAAS